MHICNLCGLRICRVKIWEDFFYEKYVFYDYNQNALKYLDKVSRYSCRCRLVSGWNFKFNVTCQESRLFMIGFPLHFWCDKILIHYFFSHWLWLPIYYCYPASSYFFYCICWYFLADITRMTWFPVFSIVISIACVHNIYGNYIFYVILL